MGVAFAVLVFVYSAVSFTLFWIIFCLFQNKRAKYEGVLDFKLPNCFWFVIYFISLALVILLGINSLIDLGVWVTVLCIIMGLICNISMFCTGESCAMFKKRSVEGGANYAKGVREAAPVLFFSVECFHEAERDEILVSKNENGRESREEKKKGDRVVTYTLKLTVGIPYWCDFTEPLYLPDGQLLVHVITKNKIEWMHGSEEYIEKWRERLYRENKNRDKECTATTHQYIPDIVHDRMIRNGDSNDVCFLLWCCPHIIAILFGFGLHFALGVATVASVVRYHVIKRASLFSPVVSSDWCRENNVDYLRIVPTAPVVGSDSFSYRDNNAQRTQPCLQNPKPLVTQLLPSSSSGRMHNAAATATASSAAAEAGSGSGSYAGRTLQKEDNGSQVTLTQNPSYRIVPEREGESDDNRE